MRQGLRFLVRSLIRRSYRYGIFYVRSRDEFPHILNAMQLLGEGAEIGVMCGDFSETLLKYWRGRKLYSVDAWKEFPAEEYRDRKNVAQVQHDLFYQETLERLREFGTRSQVMRCMSKEAAHYFKDGQLDFVYLDAQHHYAAIKEDIALWYPRIKRGGILAGHDYMDGFVNGCEYGLKSAVNELVNENKLKMMISRESLYGSWFIFA